MLVLTRKVGESCVLHDGEPNNDYDSVGRVWVKEITPEGQVKLGFEFPETVVVDRSEIFFDKVKGEQDGE